jgi:hypothetical protein
LNHCLKQRIIIEIKDFNKFIQDKEIEKIKAIQQEHPELGFTLLLPSIFPFGMTMNKDILIFIQEL